MERSEYYKKLGWEKSPFIKTTTINTPIIDRKDEFEQLQEAIGGWDRIILLTAPIGYGKTTFMNQLTKSRIKKIRYTITFNTYTDIDVIISQIRSQFSIFDKIFNKIPDRSVFGEYLAKKLGKDRMLLVFDETQDYPPEIFKWFRMLNDRCENLFMLFIGLPGLEDKIASETSLRDRKSRVLHLKTLNYDQMEDIVKKRIKWVGGSGIKPFTEDGLKRLCESASSIPRVLMENGQNVLEYCAENDIFEINSLIIEQTLGKIEPQATKEYKVVESKKEVLYGLEAPSNDFLSELSPTQQDIVNLLFQHESLSISELSEMLDKDIRSLGSLIRKLRGLNQAEIDRKPHLPYPIVVQRGKEIRNGRKQFVFALADNSRRILAKS